MYQRTVRDAYLINSTCTLADRISSGVHTVETYHLRSVLLKPDSVGGPNLAGWLGLFSLKHAQETQVIHLLGYAVNDASQPPLEKKFWAFLTGIHAYIHVSCTLPQPSF